MAQHQIPFDTGEEEKLLGPLSISQTLWLALGFFISYRVAKAIPPLPLPGAFSYVHYMIPFIITTVFAFVKFKDMPFLQYFLAWVRFKTRKRNLFFEREEI